jgi:hypothetical protein
VSSSSKVWIGLVGIIPQEGNTSLGTGAAGAYVNVLCYASSKEDYNLKVTQALQHDDFVVFEIEDVQPFLDRAADYQVDSNLLELAEEVERTKGVRGGTPHTFPREGAD